MKSEARDRLQRGALAGVVLLLLAFGFVAFVGWNAVPRDVTVYWRAGEAMRAGRQLYAPGDWSDKAYLYPPAFAAAFALLTLAPPLVGLAIWMASHFVLLVWLLGALERLCRVPTETRCQHALTLLALLLAPLAVEIREGQASLLMIACAVSGLAAIEEGRERAGGALLAAAAHVKILPALLLVTLLVQRRLVAARAMAAWLFGLCALPLLWTAQRAKPGFGLPALVDLHVDFLSAVLAPLLAGSDVAGAAPFYVFNYSIPAVLHRLFADSAFSPFPSEADWHGPLVALLPRGVLAGAGLAAWLVLIVAALWLIQRTRESRLGRAAAAGLLLLALQLGSLKLWEHHLVSLVLVFAPLLALARRSERGWRDFWIAVAPFVFILALPQLWRLAVVLLDPAAPPWRTPLREWGVPTLALLWLFWRVLRAPWSKE